MGVLRSVVSWVGLRGRYRPLLPAFCHGTIVQGFRLGRNLLVFSACFGYNTCTAFGTGVGRGTQTRGISLVRNEWTFFEEAVT